MPRTATGLAAVMTRFASAEFRISALATVVTILLYLWTSQSTVMSSLEAKALDMRFQLRGVRSPDPGVVVVAIDDKSIAELGRWPWSRRKFAEAVDRLTAAGVKVIAFDLLFTEPEDSATLDAVRTLRGAFDALGLAGTTPEVETFGKTLTQLERAHDPDGQFAAALRTAGNVVLALSFTFDAAERHEAAPGLDPPAFITRSAYRSLREPSGDGVSLPLVAVDALPLLESLGQSAASLGHVNVILDVDGALRYDYPVVEYRDAYYPSLAVQVVQRYLELQPEDVVVRFGEGIELGNVVIPTNQSMIMPVNYYGPRGTFPTYSIADVLAGRIPRERLEDRIVLIGASAIGLGDTFVTPFSPDLPGVEKHANVIASMLSGKFLHRRRSTVLIDLVLITFIGLLLGALGRRFSYRGGIACALVVGLAYVLLNVLAFTRAGLWVNLLFPLLAIVMNEVPIILFKLRTEERQKWLIRQAFGRYVSKDIVGVLLDSPDGLRLGGEAREITILVSDLRGFTSITTRLSPEEVITILNRYLERMIEILTRHRATVDEFHGDGILAFFGAPLAFGDDAERAVVCAIEMQRAMVEINDEQRRLGLPKLDMGIGINTGRVVVGNIGSEKRTKYGAVGTEINMAYRIESHTVGGQVLISSSTYERVRSVVEVRRTFESQFKGLEGAITIYDLVGISGAHQFSLPEEPGSELMPLPSPLAITCYPVEAKLVSRTGMRGHITALAESAAEVSLEGTVPVHANVKIVLDLPHGHSPLEVYAKVTALLPPRSSRDPATLAVAFTSVPEQARAFLRLAQRSAPASPGASGS